MGRDLRCLLALSLLSGALGGANAWGQPILEYKFNDARAGTSSASTGANATPLRFFNASNSPANLFSAPGLGVAGDLVGHAHFGTDRAFDNTASSGMGQPAPAGGGVARHASDLDDIDELRSWTVSGWFKASTQFSGYAVLFSNYDDNNNGFRLSSAFTDGNNVLYYVDSPSVPGSGVGYDDVNKWVFFAVTYDGTEVSNNLRFYRGYRNNAEATGGSAAVALTRTFNVNAGAMNAGNAVLQFGNRDDMKRPFDGLLDNLRLFGGKASSADSSGALTLSDLENLRASDVQLIPEPTGVALLALGAGLLIRRRRTTR